MGVDGGDEPDRWAGSHCQWVRGEGGGLGRCLRVGCGSVRVGLAGLGRPS